MLKKLFAFLLTASLMTAMPLEVFAAEPDTNGVIPEVTVTSEDDGIVPYSSISGYYSGTVTPQNPKVSVPLNSDGSGGVGITIVTECSVTEPIRVTATAYGGSKNATFIDNKKNNLISTNGTYYFVDGITHYGNNSVLFTFSNLHQNMKVTIHIYG